jgi:hypothetical protein
VFEEAINPRPYLGYAVRPPELGHGDYGLRYGNEPNPIATGTYKQLVCCLTVHHRMREEMRKRSEQGFEPTQLWKELDELKIHLLGQLERVLRQFEIPTA